MAAIKNTFSIVEPNKKQWLTNELNDDGSVKYYHLHIQIGDTCYVFYSYRDYIYQYTVINNFGFHQKNKANYYKITDEIKNYIAKNHKEFLNLDVLLQHKIDYEMAKKHYSQIPSML